MIDLYGVLQEQETVNGELGLGVDYYKGEKGEQGIPGKDGKDGSDQVYVGADEPTDERVKLWIDTDATPPSKTVSWDEIENKPEIPAPYTLPTASTSTLGGVKVDGNTLTLADGVISSVGSAEPDAYIKDASVSGNTLTLTKKDNTNVVFTPSGGGSSAVQGYAFTSGKTLTDEDKAHILEIQSNPLIPMYIDGYVVIKKVDVVETGQQLYIVLKYKPQINNHQIVIYKVSINNGSVSNNKIEIYTQYYLPVSVDDVVGTVLTNTNYSNYINISDWQYTQDQYDSNLYNAKELVVYVENTSGNKQMGYFNFGANDSNLGNNTGDNFYFDYDTSSPFIYYDGSYLNYGNANNIQYIYYKT